MHGRTDGWIEEKNEAIDQLIGDILNLNRKDKLNV